MSKFFNCVILFLFLTTSVSAATFERPLTIGSSGSDVGILQQVLKNLGFYKYPSITNYFGTITQAAVKTFQSAKGIVSSGFVGPLTRDALNNVVGDSTTTNSKEEGPKTFTFFRNLGLTARGEDVRELQKFLNAHGFPVAETGPGSPGNETTIFSPQVRLALIKFQIAHDIKPSVGFFGPLTRDKIGEIMKAESTVNESPSEGARPNTSTQPDVSTPPITTIPSVTMPVNWQSGFFGWIGGGGGGGGSSTPRDTTTPTVSITAPLDGSTVSGASVTLTANASDNVGVSSVQFAIDGVLIGTAITSAPYSMVWDSTTKIDGTYDITAVAIDAASNTTTSTGVEITIDNTAPALPTSLSGTTGDATTTLTWDDPVDADLESIKIYRGTVSGSLTLIDTIDAGIEEYTDEPLENGTTYYYAISSADTLSHESLQTAEATVTPVGVFDIYVDSVDGDDLNSGTSPFVAFQTLEAAVTEAEEIGNGVSIGLKAGSYWRESLNLNSLSGVTVKAYGTGAPPVITGFDIKTAWAQDETYTNLWYTDITHDTNGSNRPVAISDGSMMYRRTTISSANTNEGSYYSADAGTANPLRVYINPVDDPNTDGKTYEVTTRQNAVFLGDSSTVEGVVARGAMSNNGPIEVGLSSTIRKCVSAFGTKHNILIESGTIEDSVMYQSDAASQTEAGQTMLVAFTPDATGLSVNITRLLAYTDKLVTSYIYAHTLNDPAASYESITCNQCVAILNGGGSGFEGGMHEFNITNSAVYGDVASPISIQFSESGTVSHFMGEQRGDIAIQGAYENMTWIQSAISRNTVSGGSHSPITITDGSDTTITNVTVATPSNFYGNVVGWTAGGTTGNLSLNKSLLAGNNVLTVPTTATYGASNNNVFTRTDIGPYATIGGNFYDLSTNIAGFRTASSQDANSYGYNASVFTGDPSSGDFRVDLTNIIGLGHDGNAGVTEHWDYNEREIVSGPPQTWPTIPQTLEEAVNYILDPVSWDFY